MKIPPIEKVYEAWTAIADGRVKLNGDTAKVASSDGAKEYTVKNDGDKYSSDDNATYWQGYPGYPVIAVMMLQGKLPFDRQMAEKWKNINWKDINTRYRNKYAEAVKAVAEEREINLQEAAEAAEKVMTSLRESNVEIRRKI